MPTYRKLHTKIIDSYDFAEMPDDFTRVFWMLLIVVVDSEGRAIDNPTWLRSKMFPLRPDVQNKQIENTLAWLHGRNMIHRYEVDGRKYFQVCKFKDYQSGTEREAKSVLPAPPVENKHEEPPKEPDPAYNSTREPLMNDSLQDQDKVRPAVSVSVYVPVDECVKEPEPPKTPYQLFVTRLTTEYPALAFYGIDDAKELGKMFDKYGETVMMSIAKWMHESGAGLKSIAQYNKMVFAKGATWNMEPVKSNGTQQKLKRYTDADGNPVYMEG